MAAARESSAVAEAAARSPPICISDGQAPEHASCAVGTPCEKEGDRQAQCQKTAHGRRRAERRKSPAVRDPVQNLLVVGDVGSSGKIGSEPGQPPEPLVQPVSPCNRPGQAEGGADPAVSSTGPGQQPGSEADSHGQRPAGDGSHRLARSGSRQHQGPADNRHEKQQPARGGGRSAGPGHQGQKRDKRRASGGGFSPGLGRRQGQNQDQAAGQEDLQCGGTGVGFCHLVHQSGAATNTPSLSRMSRVKSVRVATGDIGAVDTILAVRFQGVRCCRSGVDERVGPVVFPGNHADLIRDEQRRNCGQVALGDVPRVNLVRLHGP